MINIIPVNDLKEHIEFADCDCNPKIINEDGEAIIIHNSYDRRELLEEAIQIMNEETEDYKICMAEYWKKVLDNIEPKNDLWKILRG